MDFESQNFISIIAIVVAIIVIIIPRSRNWITKQVRKIPLIIKLFAADHITYIVIIWGLIAALIGSLCNLWQAGSFGYDFITTIVSTAVLTLGFTIPYDMRKQRDTELRQRNENENLQKIIEEKIKPLLEDQQKEFRDEVGDSIVKSLGAESKIIQKYNTEEMIRVMSNCSKQLREKLLYPNVERVFFSILASPTYRENMEYNITIEDNKESSENEVNEFDYYTEFREAKFIISQTLSYTKYLKRSAYGSGAYTLSCYFSFRRNPFLHRGRGEVLFLREELSSDSLIEYLINHSNDKEEIIRCLGYSVSICPVEVGDSDDEDFDCFNCAFYTVRLEDLTVELVYVNGDASGIKIKCSIPETAVRDKGEFCTFQARIKCKYSTGLQEFYFKVPEFTQDAHVDIKLDNNTSQLHIVSFADNYKERQYVDNGFYFDPINENDKTLLPNNGFTAVW